VWKKKGQRPKKKSRKGTIPKEENKYVTGDLKNPTVTMGCARNGTIPDRAKKRKTLRKGTFPRAPPVRNKASKKRWYSKKMCGGRGFTPTQTKITGPRTNTAVRQ